MKDKPLERYTELIRMASKLRVKSLEGNPKAREEYNRLLESKEFIELENYLLYATDK